MRILLVTPCFPPLHAVASLRTYDFARTWSQAGHDVTVLSTPKRRDQAGLDLPSTGFQLVEVPYSVPWFLEDLRGGYKEVQRADIATPTQAPTATRHLKATKALVWRCFRAVRDYTGIFGAARMPDLTDFWVEPAFAWAQKQGRREPWDVVVSSAGPYTAHLVGRRLKQFGLARRWVCEFRDLWTENCPFRGLFPFSLKERNEERQCLDQADLVVTVSPGLAHKLQRKTMTPVEVIYNGYDRDKFDALAATPAFPDDGRRRLVYTGTLYPHGQDPRPLFEAIAQLRDDRLVVAVAGDSGAIWRGFARSASLEGQLEDNGRVPHERALRMQRDAAAILHFEWPDPRLGVLSGKLFEYLVTGTPILILGGRSDSPMASVVRECGRGLALGRSVDRIRQVLRDLVEDPSRLNQQPNHDAIAALSRRRQSLRLLDLMSDRGGIRRAG